MIYTGIRIYIKAKCNSKNMSRVLWKLWRVQFSVDNGRNKEIFTRVPWAKKVWNNWFKHVRYWRANNIQLVAGATNLEGILGNISKPSSLICASGETHHIASTLHLKLKTPQGSEFFTPESECVECKGREDMHWHKKNPINIVAQLKEKSCWCGSMFDAGIQIKKRQVKPDIQRLII